MKQSVRKAFWNFEKEEQWLNLMAAQGLSLVDYSWCRYVFEETAPATYHYRIELLEHPVSDLRSRQYIQFLEESGIECVSWYMRWIYLRKKVSDGPFVLFSNIDSRIAHHKRVLALFDALAILELGVGILNISLGLTYRLLENRATVNVWFGLPLVAMGVFFLIVGHPVRRQIKRWKAERVIVE
jgi:hypothetical protein